MADEAAGKETGSVSGALLHFVTRLPALLNPKPQVPVTMFGTFSQAALLLQEVSSQHFLLPKPGHLFLSSPLLPPSDAALPPAMPGHSRATAGRWTRTPGPRARTPPSSCSILMPLEQHCHCPAITPRSLLLFKVWGGGKQKNPNSHQLLVTSEWEKKPQPSNNRPTATPLAEAEEARGPAREAALQAPASRALCGSPPCAVRFWRAVSTLGLKPSTSFPARGHGARGLSPATCPPTACTHLQQLPCSRHRDSWGVPKPHNQTHLRCSKAWHDRQVLHPQAAGPQGWSPLPTQRSQSQRSSAVANHWNTAWTLETCRCFFF